MKRILDLYFPFTEFVASANPSSAYLYQIIYVAKGTAEEIHTLLSKEQIQDLTNLDASEVVRLEKAFDRGMAKIYLAITSDFNNYDLTKFGEENVGQISFTQIISPEFVKPATLPNDIGVLCFHTESIPVVISDKNVCDVYDPEKQGKGLGIFAEVLSKNTFFNNQFGVFNEYIGVHNIGEASSLKTNKTTFLFLNDGTSDNLLGMWAIGGKAPMDIYIEELWKFEVQNALKDFLQIENPNYTDEDILKIEKEVDKVSDSLFAAYGLIASPSRAPLKENQLASDIDAFTVSGVQVSLEMPSQIYGISTVITIS